MRSAVQIPSSASGEVSDAASELGRARSRGSLVGTPVIWRVLGLFEEDHWAAPLGKARSGQRERERERGGISESRELFLLVSGRRIQDSGSISSRAVTGRMVERQHLEDSKGVSVGGNGLMGDDTGVTDRINVLIKH